MVMRLNSQRLPLHRSAKAESAVEAYLAPRGLAALVRCRKGWCRVRADGVTGWAPETELWGTDERPQCR
jgi:SH3-like domain-containing protein